MQLAASACKICFCVSNFCSVWLSHPQFQCIFQICLFYSLKIFYSQNKLYQSGRQSNGKTACDCQSVPFKLYPSGRQSLENCTRMAASRRQIPNNFFKFCVRLVATRVEFVCNWRPLGYNLNTTGGHLVTIRMRLAAKAHANFACDWRPVQCQTASFLKARCEKNYLN